MELQIIREKIYTIRSTRVMLDFDLAELYQTETRTLKQAVRRNIERFPNDFMFELNKSEKEDLVSQNVIADIRVLGGAKPFAFTEQGVAMLSSVLRTKKAISVNIAIMRAFVLVRQYLTDYQELKKQIESLEQEMNIKFKDINQALNYLLNPKSKRKTIGFKQYDRDE